MEDHIENLIQKMFSNEDSLRCQQTLTKLAQHLNGTLMLTGSLAVDWHATQNGCQVARRPLNDIDIVVADISALSPSLNQDFLISHFHPTRGAGRILLQLVDETHRVRIDLFTPNSPSLPSRVQHTELFGIDWGIVAAEDLTAKLLAILYGVTAGEQVDPKYYNSFRLLAGLADLGLVREIWSEYRKPDYSRSFDDAADAVHQRIANDPSVLRKDVYGQDVRDSCPWCIQSSTFPVSTRAKIFEVLGYV